ncbi:hypothetical protein BT93_H1119 [Corymbia citriodora subsp. variegata]|nr:hypothetical protein BT93_H1119 [Corymbia citriodora subsp. variegata]
MGNWLGKKAQVHPRAQQPSPGIRVKVTMTRTQLRELMSQVDPGRGGAELGPLILRECLEGSSPSVCRCTVKHALWRELLGIAMLSSGVAITLDRRRSRITSLIHLIGKPKIGCKVC